MARILKFYLLFFNIEIQNILLFDYYICHFMCDQKSQKQLFSPRRRCLNLLFRQQ